jgi:hypothetical protein
VPVPSEFHGVPAIFANDGQHRNHCGRDYCVCSDLLAMGTEAEMTPISLAASIALKEDFSGMVEQTVRLSPI